MFPRDAEFHGKFQTELDKLLQNGGEYGGCVGWEG